MSLSSPADWSCTTPLVGSGGTVSCVNPAFAVGSADFTLTVKVGANVAHNTVLSNTAQITSGIFESNSGDEKGIAETRVVAIPFTASISDPFACNGAGGTVTVTAFLTNPNSSSASASFTVTLPAELNVVNNSCTATTGACSTTLPKQINWSGTLGANQTVQIQYQAEIVAGVLPGQLITVDSVGVVNGLEVTTSVSDTVSCPADSLTNPPVNTALSDQKPGSILVFPYYTSDANGNFNQADTLISITNVSNGSPTLPSGVPNYQYLHLFFMNKDCSPADTFVCLTPNGTLQFKASEFDPLTTGYLIAVAVDEQGRPTQNNSFIGSAFVRNDQNSIIDSYGAESFWKYSSGAVAAGSDGSATIYFDGINYDQVPIQFSTPLQDPSRSEQKLILATLAGDLGTKLNSAAQNLTGAVYRDDEALASFTNALGSGCLIERAVTSSNFRIAPGSLA
ncbi:MAG TPA: hypothetical protein VEF04_02790, partial [Blastocatellia bacterium]|nr:hypothetical protein [Blastocatellia bacterium]